MPLPPVLREVVAPTDHADAIVLTFGPAASDMGLKVVSVRFLSRTVQAMAFTLEKTPFT